ncbi:MAG: hypothetical protein N2246_01400 [Candidatus Sumerlaeia bacterium]|nr:hypothetical protein [Candidatus Sumerlaeia bacterium]
MPAPFYRVGFTPKPTLVEKKQPDLSHLTASNSRLIWRIFSRVTLLLFLAGLVLLAVGFLLLSFVDPRAENIFAFFSPLFIILAYILMFVALLLNPGKK